MSTMIGKCRLACGAGCLTPGRRHRHDSGRQQVPDALFDGSSLKGALPAVSENRLTKTLYAEHPDLKRFMSALEGPKTNHSVQSLAAIWEVPQDEAKTVALRLVDIGFFEKRAQMQFWVPFLYRPALNLVQGSAEGVSSLGDVPPEEEDSSDGPA